MSVHDQWRKVLDAELRHCSAKPCDQLMAEPADTNSYEVQFESKPYQVEVELLENTHLHPRHDRRRRRRPPGLALASDHDVHLPEAMIALLTICSIFGVGQPRKGRFPSTRPTLTAPIE